MDRCLRGFEPHSQQKFIWSYKTLYLCDHRGFFLKKYFIWERERDREFCSLNFSPPPHVVVRIVSEMRVKKVWSHFEEDHPVRGANRWPFGSQRVVLAVGDLAQSVLIIVFFLTILSCSSCSSAPPLLLSSSSFSFWWWMRFLPLLVRCGHVDVWIDGRRAKEPPAGGRALLTLMSVWFRYRTAICKWDFCKWLLCN